MWASTRRPSRGLGADACRFTRIGCGRYARLPATCRDDHRLRLMRTDGSSPCAARRAIRRGRHIATPCCEGQSRHNAVRPRRARRKTISSAELMHVSCRESYLRKVTFSIVRFSRPLPTNSVGL